MTRVVPDKKKTPEEIREARLQMWVKLWQRPGMVDKDVPVSPEQARRLAEISEKYLAHFSRINKQYTASWVVQMLGSAIRAYTGSNERD